MEEKHPIDQWLKDSFKQTNLEGMEGLWNRIDQTLDQRKKRRKAFIWIPILFGIIGSSIIAYRYIKSPDELTNLTIANEKSENKGNIENLNSRTEKLSPIPLNEERNALENKQNNNLGTAGTSKIANLPRKIEQIDPQTSANYNKLSVAENAKVNQANDVKTETNNFDLQKYKKPTVSAAIETTLLFWKVNKMALSRIANPQSIIPHSLPISNVLPRLETKKIEQSTKNYKNAWTIGINAGFSPSKELLSVNSASLPYVHKDYLGIRQNSENPIIASQYQGFVRKNFGGFHIQLGFTQMTRAYSQNYNFKITEVPIINQVRTAQDANGRFPLDNQTPYLRVSNPEVITYSGKVTKNYFEVPLSLGYTFKWKKALISPSFGMGFNFQNQIGGTTIDYQELTLTNLNSLFQTEKRTLTAFSGIAVEYPIMKNLFIQAQPFYHRFISSNTQTISQTPISFGINLGLNYKIARK